MKLVKTYKSVVQAKISKRVKATVIEWNVPREITKQCTWNPWDSMNSGLCEVFKYFMKNTSQSWSKCVIYYGQARAQRTVIQSPLVSIWFISWSSVRIYITKWQQIFRLTKFTPMFVYSVLRNAQLHGNQT